MREIRKMIMRRVFNHMVSSGEYTVKQAFDFAREHNIGKPFEKIDAEIIEELSAELKAGDE